MTTTVLDREVTLDEALHALIEKLGPDYVVSRAGRTTLTVRKRHGVLCATVTANTTDGHTAFTVHGHGVTRAVSEALDACFARRSG